MGTKFNFNSQICTTKEQSERLIALGLKKETADMALVPLMEWDDCTAREYFTGIYVERTKEDVERYNLDYIPSWSLHRLIELCRKEESGATLELVSLDQTYDKYIGQIRSMIKEGYFNKEYLV